MGKDFSAPNLAACLVFCKSLARGLKKLVYESTIGMGMTFINRKRILYISPIVYCVSLCLCVRWGKGKRVQAVPPGYTIQ